MNNNDSLPHVSILLLTYRRTAEALRTIRSTCDNLNYPKELRSFYIADDGSPPDHIQQIVAELSDREENIIGYHNTRMRLPGQEGTHNAGIGWNKGLGICHQKTDFVLVCEDDWELDEPLDLIPYVKLLQDYTEIGICTFRILSIGADVHTLGFNGEMFIRYERSTQYAFSGNPYLRHARYTRRYGWFAEDRNPGLMELHQDDQYRLAMEGPVIVRPLKINAWGAWKHIGSDKTWS